MARQLTAVGQTTEFLGLIDTAAPGYRRRALFERLGRRLRRLPRRAITIASQAFTAEPESGDGIRHIHLVALSKYTAEAYPGAVHLFRSALWSDGEHPTTGWRDLLSGVVTVLDVPCDHDQIVRDPADPFTRISAVAGRSAHHPSSHGHRGRRCVRPATPGASLSRGDARSARHRRRVGGGTRASGFRRMRGSRLAHCPGGGLSVSG